MESKLTAQSYVCSILCSKQRLFTVSAVRAIVAKQSFNAQTIVVKWGREVGRGWKGVLQRLSQ